MIRFFQMGLLACATLLVSCKDTGFTFVAKNSIAAHSVSIGSGIQAIPGQEVVVFAFLTLPAGEVSSSSLSVGNGVSVEHGPLTSYDSKRAGELRGTSPLESRQYQTMQRMKFFLPLSLTGGTALQMVYQAKDFNGVEYRATAALTVVEQESAGQTANYDWDLRLFAENKNESDVPEISVFDVEGTTQIIRNIYPPDFPEEDLPFPKLLQPQTGVVVGTRDIYVNCDLPIGSGYCVTLEDTFHEEADRDYDLLFAARPGSEKFILEAKGLSPMGAKNATDVVFRNINRGIERIRMVRYKRRNLPGRSYRYQSSSTYQVEDRAARIRLWDDQHDTLNVTEYQWKYEITFLENR